MAGEVVGLIGFSGLSSTTTVARVPPAVDIWQLAAGGWLESLQFLSLSPPSCPLAFREITKRSLIWHPSVILRGRDLPPM